MSEPVTPAPLSTGGEPAPAPAPVAPAPAVPAPGTTEPAPVTTDTTTAAPDAAKTDEQNEDDEWADAEKEIFGKQPTAKQEKTDESAKPKTTDQTTQAPVANPDDKKPNAEQGASDDTNKGSGKSEAPSATEVERVARQSARSYAQQVDTFKADVIKTMFSDVPDTLQDADGDPINSIEDVMKLKNGRTNEAFTEEEAGMWLLHNQQKFNENRADMEKKAEAIAEVNIDMKYEADAVNEKFGEYLKAHPEFRDELWVEFLETLEIDKATNLITKMPVSLEKYYERNVGYRVEAAKTDETAKANVEAERVAAEAKAKEDAEKAKQAKRQDRSDIYGNSNVDTRDDDTKEWDDAKTAVFGPLK